MTRSAALVKVANLYLADAQPAPMMTVRVTAPCFLFALWFVAGVATGVAVALAARLAV